jgi:hypothetical protein
MSRTPERRAGAATLLVTMSLWLAAAAATTRARLLTVTRQRRDRGAVSLEQAIITAVISAAAIALGVVIVNAVTSHSANIK